MTPARAPEVFLHAQASSHEPYQINWCEFVNRADGISEIEGKAATVAASEQGQRATFKFVSALVSSPLCEFVKFVSEKRL
jgi:hypothetical protein